jgi:glycine oxidase
VAVIGAGVIGLAVAWRAAQRRLRVVVLDRATPGAGTSHVAAGMLAPVSEASLVEREVLGLGLVSAELYPSFIEQLHAAAGTDPGYLRCGTLVVARDRDEAEGLERELDLRRSLGLTVRRLRASEARALAPSLAPTVRLALLAEGDHALDPRRLVAALLAAGRAAEVRFRWPAKVSGIETGAHGAVRGVRLEDGDTISAPQVVVAAGSWSGDIGGIPGSLRVPLHPVKGQIMRLHDPRGPGLLTRVLRTRGGYIVPRGDGRYVLGGTMEERGFDTSVTAGAVYELLREASDLVPGISELVVDEISAGLRPGTPDNAPAIGPSELDGLHWAVGHYRHGILLAPVTAEIIAGALIGEPTPEYALNFTPGRFAREPIAVGA